MTKIGVINLTNTWKELLEQFGVNYSEVRRTDNLSFFSLIIVNSDDISTFYNKLNSFIEKGGSLLDCKGNFYNNTQTSFRNIFKKFYIFENDLFNGLIDINTKVKEIFNKENNSWNIYQIKKQGDGNLAYLGLPIEKLFLNKESERRKFLSNSYRHPEEEVNNVSKGAISRLIFNTLKHLHISRDLPFIHKWFFPGTEQNIFLFREDTDYSKKEDIEEIQKIAISNNISVTWFVHIKENIDFLQTYQKSPLDEIALHCYDHFTSSKYQLIKNDITKALELLDTHNIKPTGYAAPYGIWNKNLNRVLTEENFKYSSEFSLIYDSLPIHTDITNNILQISTHPICLDSLLKNGSSKNEIFEYYKQIIDFNLFCQIPVSLYDHPGHGNYDILNQIFNYINSLKLKSLTYNEYSSWWSSRRDSVFNVFLNTDYKLNVEISGNTSLCIWRDEDEFCLIDKDGLYDIRSIEYCNTLNIKKPDIPKLKSIHRKDYNMIKRAYLAKYIWRNKK